MDARIVEFAEVLRQNGLKVAMSETLDAARATTELGLDDREQFRAVLCCTLCKREGDVSTFDRAFDFYFSGAAKSFEQIDEALAKRLEEEGLLQGDDLKMILWMLPQLAAGMSPMAQAALSGDRALLAQLFRSAALQLDFGRMQSSLQTGFFTRRMLVGAGVDRMRSDLQSLASELGARGVTTDGLEVVSRYLSEAMRKVEEAARQEVDRQGKARLKKATGGLNDRAFHTLSRREVEQAQRAVRALAEKLKTRLVRRARSRRKGALHPIRTLRKNLTTGGVPMVPQFRTRRPQRPEVVVLCDVSDSVRNASRMMLLFTYTMQELFTRVRSFVFVSEVGEVTKLFKDTPPEEAIDLATAGKVISVASNSNYGNALAKFSRGWLGSVSRRTTVLVIGDGRNNYNPANVWALEDLKRKAKRVVWICTEPRTSWGFGDSEMNNYSKACSQVVTVQTLADLEQVAAQLVPT
jgi:uncharacterized protein with von Willebrand factor type A (vWA) domain